MKEPARRIGFLLLPDFPLMSYASAIEPLRAANVLAGGALFRWSNLSIDGQPARASVGLEIAPDLGLNDAQALDALFVCAGGNPAAFRHKPTFARLRALAAAGVEIGGMSGGAYILARAGLLERRRCTIHWEHIPALLEEFPDLLLERTLYVFDGDRATCAGGLAAFDMMVDLVERRHGAALAVAVGEWYLRTQSRSGEEAQRPSLRERTRVANAKVLKALALMEERIEHPLSRAELAESAGVTLRQLERLFAAHLGRPLASHYLGLRLDRARKLLRQTSLPIVEVALASGFAASSHFSRVYRTRFGLAPSAERRHR
ncbi:GlxA family transcriptional regulator [Rhodoblastus acidophilus]|jgi:transcriptional regulator GlxA family with amidase domain|uniref:GlxA family transcriptional regulator n=1 Tax=Candidatus Rhodoblastus alkanivorans TaxID=2954117 RepID=A0ABS9Z255_9HYPH|nr:GlxA family transcriptional regulator [Candidatus Rhodoblastus alkanivorans]MCI4679014.1 GlxA family transcriptional regulator [Candidatus Rhodoblastus alkanivorans]MCI4681731.1 GlxA family transcriptional regulator [Candidatus Rhodoblastus alkanivorans]MDI4642780.1 GlxA family transcriptional regulator [Rhodoblastus acidophilus]